MNLINGKHTEKKERKKTNHNNKIRTTNNKRFIDPGPYKYITYIFSRSNSINK